MKYFIRIFFVSVFLLQGMLFGTEINENLLIGILNKIDSYRLPSDSMKYTVQIEVVGKALDAEVEEFIIFSKGNKSLIEMQSQKSRGQKVLVLDKQMWVKMPKSSRVIRITPLQRLTGQASFSDLARLQFSETYTIEKSESILRNGIDCIRLYLKAKEKNETYSTVHLIVESDTAYPVFAEFFLSSGKKFKILEFEPPEQIFGKQINTRYTIYDEMVKDQKTVLTVSEISLLDIPDYQFSIAYLEAQ